MEAFTFKTFLAIGKKKELKIPNENVISNFTSSPFENYCESERMIVYSNGEGERILTSHSASLLANYKIRENTGRTPEYMQE